MKKNVVVMVRLDGDLDLVDEQLKWIEDRAEEIMVVVSVEY